MAQAAEHGQPLLELARGFAWRHAKDNGVVTVEDVRKALDVALTPRAWESGNWMGSIFREHRDESGARVWEPTGRAVMTEHKGGHRRRVLEWRLTSHV
jgi:hypothetical protein